MHLCDEGGSACSRRALLRRGLAMTGAFVAGTGTLTGCAAAGDSGAGSSAPRILLAYFSRPGENYYRGGRRTIDVGNTEVLARQIASLVACDTYRIDAADPYPSDYDATVARNVRETDDDARPGIARPLPPMASYDTVLLGSPIWNVRTPMIMMTFAEGVDLAGKTVHPFVTYAVSGLGRAVQDYTTAAPGARVRPGLAVRGEEADDHEDDVRSWLRQAGLLD